MTILRDIAVIRCFPKKDCLSGKADFTGCNTAYQTTSVHRTIYSSWRAGGFVNMSANPASGFHRLQRLRQGAIGNCSQVSFDLIEVTRLMDCSQNRQGPRTPEQILICLISDTLNFVGKGSCGNSKHCQSKLWAQRMAIAGVSFQQSDRNEVVDALRESGPARPGGSKKRRLSSGNACMQARQNRNGPSPGGRVDKGSYVHKV